jgi:ketosteroid isomerase-like protein
MLLFRTRRMALGIGMVIAVASMLTACQKTDDTTPGATTPPEGSTDASAQADTIKAEIDKLRSAYEAAVAAGDDSAMSSLLADGAVMVRPGAPDWEAMAAAAPGRPFPPGAKIAISPIEVVALSKEWAYEFGTATTTYTPPGSQEAVQLHDTYLLLFRNTGTGWKAYREVASSAPPPGGWRVD